jgi:thiol-disulfide isomerase/thioredoxin
MPKKLIFVFVLVLAACIGFYFYNKYRVAPSVNVSKLPLVTLEGEPFDFQSLKGKKVILSFSASWCGNCIHEMNALKKIKDSELSDVEIVIIDDEPIETVMKFKNNRQYPFTFVKLNSEFPTIGINSIPVTYFYNSHQEITGNEVGEIEWSDPSTREHFKQILN